MTTAECARARVKKLALHRVGRRRPECADERCPHKYVVDGDRIVGMRSSDALGWKVIVTYDFGTRATICPACALRKYPGAAREHKLLTKLRLLAARQSKQR